MHHSNRHPSQVVLHFEPADPRGELRIQKVRPPRTCRAGLTRELQLPRSSAKPPRAPRPNSPNRCGSTASRPTERPRPGPGPGPAELLREMQDYL